MHAHSHRDLWGPHVQLWTVCEPQLGGETLRERWMACSVVFCLLSVRALPSVKRRAAPASVQLVCHIERFLKQPLCKLCNSCRLQTEDALYFGEHIFESRISFIGQTGCAHSWSIGTQKLIKKNPQNKTLLLTYPTLKCCKLDTAMPATNIKQACKSQTEAIANNKIKSALLPANWAQSDECTSYWDLPVSTVFPPCLRAYQLASFRQVTKRLTSFWSCWVQTPTPQEPGTLSSLWQCPVQSSMIKKEISA